MDPSQSYYGRIPSHFLDTQMELVLRLHEDDMELAAQRTSVYNSLQYADFFFMF
jgi:hypothetical protein